MGWLHGDLHYYLFHCRVCWRYFINKKSPSNPDHLGVYRMDGWSARDKQSFLFSLDKSRRAGSFFAKRQLDSLTNWHITDDKKFSNRR